mmetsp:Transcript_79957/g.259099  ORF Transcript_79957/g.259099 Transcript_79957/m.259099 type:complete len:202 (-) Transcript_79957:9153-9758(-)
MTRSREGWKATVSGISSCGRTKPSDGVIENNFANLGGISNLNFEPKSPKLCKRTFLVAWDPTTTSPKKHECSLRRISVAWQVPSTVSNFKSNPPSQRASNGTLNGATRVVGMKRISTSQVSRGRKVVGWTGDHCTNLFDNSSWSSPSWNVTAHGDRLTSLTILVIESPPVATPKSTCCISKFVSSRRNGQPRPRTSTCMCV